MIADNMKWETFSEFCNRANELRELYQIRVDTPSFLLKEYRDYIYTHDYGRYSDLVNGKCWEWLLSNVYEPMSKNDLYSVLGLMRKGR